MLDGEPIRPPDPLFSPVHGGLVSRDQWTSIVTQSFVTTASESGAGVPPELGESTPLVGPGSVLDSMALVTLLLDVEQRLEEQAGVSVTLMNEQALSRRHSPFRTIGSLADYIVELSITDDPVS